MRKYRVLIYARLKMESPFHVGSGHTDDSFTDQPVLRDICDVPFIAGGALAGSFADNLDDHDRFEWMGI
ncbi:MAG: hypothetical protein J7M20_03310, partial [Deltaproteobacteria bacterium]|nr:hypothetical protein [Deltaproteobacteria bacterium]